MDFLYYAGLVVAIIFLLAGIYCFFQVLAGEYRLRKIRRQQDKESDEVVKFWQAETNRMLYEMRLLRLGLFDVYNMKSNSPIEME